MPLRATLLTSSLNNHLRAKGRALDIFKTGVSAAKISPLQYLKYIDL